MEKSPFVARVILAVAIVALAVIAWKISGVFMLAFAGGVFATAIRAASVPLARRLHLPEGISVALVLAVAAAAIALGGWGFGHQVGEQADAMWEAITAAPAKVETFLEGSRVGRTLVESLKGATSPETMAKVAKGTFTVFGAIADLGLVIFLAVYFASDPRTYRKGALALLPVAVRPRVDRALDAAGTMLHKWLLGQLGAMATVGILIGVGLALLGMPLAVPLAVLSGLLEFVPIVGPFTALFVGVLVAFGQGPEMALYVGLLYAAVLFVEGNVIIPLAQKWAVSLPPALGLVGIAVAGVLFGIAGVLFAMPLLVVAVTLVRKLYVPVMDGKKAD